MRIIGHIPHPSLKITVFKMDNKLSVKFEAGLYEQTYKFRESNELASFQDVERLIDGPFCDAVLAQLEVMHRIKNEGLGRFSTLDETEVFEEII